MESLLVTFPITLDDDDDDFVTIVALPDDNVAITVTPLFSTKLPPAVPPVAKFVTAAQVKFTFIAINVFPFATSTSDAPRLAHVSHEPEPLAALFH
jgi:hypothetical protein